MKKLLVSLFLALSITTSFAAEMTTTVKVAAPNCDTTAPCVVIKNNANLLSDAMNSNKSNKETIQLIQNSILPSINFKLITATAMGAHWKDATPDQQAKITDLFQQLLVNTYATALSKFKGSAITIASAQITGENKNKAVVKTTITLPQTSDGKTKDVAVDYNLASIKDAWKIYDVKIENISLIVTYRSQFDDIINKDGMDGLITQLQNKVTTLKK